MKFDLLDGAGAAPLVDAIRDLYAEVYAEPPYYESEEDVARFVGRFTEDEQRVGFSLSIASNDDELIGAAYGWTMESGRWFKWAKTEVPGTLRGASKFAIMEWLVRRQ